MRMRGGPPKGSGNRPHVAYVLPRHPNEVDRLDVLHYALREAVGANFLTPVTTPTDVLDVGCGTGQWAYDLCAQFPEAFVVGLDLEPSKPNRPPNYRFIRSNLLQGLPFASDGFDFVHQRLMTSGVPLASWSAVVRDLVRVTAPGGSVELVEAWPEVEQAGPSTERLFEMGRRLASSHGLDTTAIICRSLDGYLRNAGLIDVARHDVDIPVGEWGGQVGIFMASAFRAMFTRLGDAFQARLGVAESEWRSLVEAMQLEWDQNRSLYRITLAYGRKTRR
ncbi:MAG TPA: class I SAM-dependent methyltransferase [Candidatus Dormibacteraeota bacterium]|nr:class I SAM-dependent methyltransferase [Candidatus Dormibacteraeota bacterium]